MTFAYRAAKLKLFASIFVTDAKPRNVMRHSKDRQLKPIIIILTALTFIQSIANGQVNNSSFSFSYYFAGLGSNIGSMQPTIRINGTKLLYTYEQNSYYGEKTKIPDTMRVTTIRQTSIDSILTLINDLKDSTIYETNPCIMSGGIHSMTISNKGDTTRFTLHNTFHRTALKILEIVNPYLPQDKKIWATEQDIILCENCWAAMRKKRLEKEKKKE